MADLPAASLIAAGVAASACERNRVQRIAVLSLIGSAWELRSSPVSILRELERPFLGCSSTVRVVRAGLFVDHLTAMAPSVAASGTLALPFPADLRLPWVVARDVALELVAGVDGASEGHVVQDVSGPDPLTALELAHLMSGSLRSPIQFVTLAAGDTATHLESLGVRPRRARCLAALWTAAASGLLNARTLKNRLAAQVRTSVGSWVAATMCNAVQRNRRVLV